MKPGQVNAPPGALTTVVLVVVILTITAGLIWLWRRRTFINTSTVADAYDRWTEDQLLERLWGEHVHLGHYGDRPHRPDVCGFPRRQA